MEPLAEIYPVNQISKISKDRFLQFADKVEVSNKLMCSAPSGRRQSSPAPDAPFGKVYGVLGIFDDENGKPRDGLKFTCKATQRNILHIDERTPVYGRVFYGIYKQIKYSDKNNEEYTQVPQNLVLVVGDTEFKTNDNYSQLMGNVNHPTEFWLYVDESPLVLKDNKNGLNNNQDGFEFVLFFYSEQSLDYLRNKITEYEQDKRD